MSFTMRSLLRAAIPVTVLAALATGAGQASAAPDSATIKGRVNERMSWAGQPGNQRELTDPARALDVYRQIRDRTTPGTINRGDFYGPEPKLAAAIAYELAIQDRDAMDGSLNNSFRIAQPGTPVEFYYGRDGRAPREEVSMYLNNSPCDGSWGNAFRFRAPGATGCGASPSVYRRTGEDIDWTTGLHPSQYLRQALTIIMSQGEISAYSRLGVLGGS